MTNDPVHALVQKAVAAINESEPLGLTATQVFHDGLVRLSAIELDALRETGWHALRHDDAFLPVDARMPEFDVSQRTRELVAGGRDDALSEVPESDTPALVLTGFVALVREAKRELVRNVLRRYAAGRPDLGHEMEQFLAADPSVKEMVTYLKRWRDDAAEDGLDVLLARRRAGTIGGEKDGER